MNSTYPTFNEQYGDQEGLYAALTGASGERKCTEWIVTHTPSGPDIDLIGKAS